MKKLNTTLDREPMNSEAIRQRQNFNYILKETAAAKIPIWKSIWFYGPVGIAMVTMVVSAVRMNPQNETNDNNITLSQFTTSITETNSAKTSSAERSKEALTETKSDSKKDNKIAAVEKERNEKTTVAVIPEQNKSDEKEVFQAIEKETRAEQKSPINEPTPKEAPVFVKPVNTMPNIAGVFSGRISVSQICSTGKVECNNGYTVISYDIQYDNGAESTVDRISGEEIPGYICSKLQRYNVGSPVFITNIIAMNEKGERKKLLSMSIEPTF